jgi:hypothetical protein
MRLSLHRGLGLGTIAFSTCVMSIQDCLIVICATELFINRVDKGTLAF